MGIYTGFAKVVLHVEKGVQLKRGVEGADGTFTAAQVADVIPRLLDAAVDQGQKLDRWSFYQPEFHAKLAKDVDTIGSKVFLAFVSKTKGHSWVLGYDKFGNPVARYLPDVVTSGKVKKTEPFKF